MNILIGDIGNTVTKICLIDDNKFIIKKKFFLSTKQITSEKILKKKLCSFLRNELINPIALFSSVVPKYEKSIKKIL
jgi:type III pantothenate kinase